MDSKQVNSLLEKYWNCETSLEEEQVLRKHFNGQDIPDSLSDTAALFQYFEAEKTQVLDHSFDNVVINELHERPKGKVIALPLIKIARIAAGVLVVIAAAYFIREEIRKSYPPEIAETYSDPKLALEETKKALMMISNSFNKAQKGAEQIKIFNKAETEIQGKTIPDDKEQKQL